MNGWQRFGLRAGVVLLAAAVVGLPINELFEYGLLLAIVVAAFAGAVCAESRRWIGAIVLAALVAVGHGLFPAPRIDEGFNVFVPPSAGNTAGLPDEVLRALIAQYNTQYPPQNRCADPARGCWRPDRTPAMNGHAFSADGTFDHGAFSRRVSGIRFSDPVWLRIGVLNERTYNWPDNISDVKRFERDRRSLNVFDRFHVTFPLLLTWRFPAEFAGSELCWSGTVFWEKFGGGYEQVNHDAFACRVLRTEDTGRNIHAASILHDAKLAVTLRASWQVQLRRIFENGLTAIGIIGIGLMLLRVESRRLLLPVILIGTTSLLTVFTDIHFIGGFRPLDGGDDGIMYEGFAREIVRALLAGDFISALKGGEAVYYFTPGFRYFRAIERLLFGDTFLGYFSVILLLPFLTLALAKRLMPANFALGLILLFVLTPAGVLFGSTITDYIVAAARGYGDPLSFALVLAGFVAIIPPTNDTRLTVTGAFLGGLSLAMATFCRPNMLLACGMMMVCALFIGARQREWRWCGALALGFAALAVSPLHNWVFGHSTIPFSDNVNQPQTLLMPPSDYFRAAYDVLTLNFGSAYVSRAFAQLGRWLSGTHKLMIAIPINLAAFIVLLRVGIFNRGFAPWLRAVALAALLQHGIGICYVNYDRYNLLTWLLTAIVTFAWLASEGIPFFARRWPNVTGAIVNAPAFLLMARWFTRLQQALDFPGANHSTLGGMAR
jgi:hypothetical protein